MSYIPFHDISKYQGAYNMDADPSPIIEMRMTGFYYGSKQPYADSQAMRNYSNAIRLGKVPLLYHFAGGADPIVEADYFINVGCSPLADGDVYELDYELTDEMGPPADPDTWCRAFADRVKTRTGAYPLFYTNTSLFLRHGGFPKTMEVCALIIADYRYTPDQDVPCHHPYIIHQYTDSPIDTNACFVDLDTLKRYARHAQASQPPIVVPPVVPVDPVVPPVTSPVVPEQPSDPVVPPETPPVVVEPPVDVPPVIVTPPVTKKHWYDWIIALLVELQIIK